MFAGKGQSGTAAVEECPAGARQGHPQAAWVHRFSWTDLEQILVAPFLRARERASPRRARTASSRQTDAPK